MRLLVVSALDAAIVVGIGLVITGLLKRRSAAFRHWILAATLLAAAVVPLVELLGPTWNLPVARPSIATSVELTIDALQPVSTAEIAATSDEVPGSAGWSVALMAIWGTGLIAAVAMFGAGLVKLRRLVRGAERVADARWVRLVTAIANCHGLAGQVDLLYAQHPTPVALGWRRPAILLPLDARQWRDDRMRIVLHHELAHIARRDWPIQIAAAFLCCVYWFNPLIWMAYRALRRESERACDDLVLASGIEPADYATHLLAMATRGGTRESAWSPATPIVHASMLEERIHAMLDSRVNRDPVTKRKRVFTTAIVALLALPVTAFTTEAPAASGRSAAASAKQAFGTIVGVLYDQHNGLLPEAEISLSEDRTGTILTARSDQTGAFSFRELPPGDYTLVTELRGFARVRNLIRVAPGSTVKRNIVLPLGQLEETITVVSDRKPEKARSAPPVRSAREIPEPRVPSPCVGRIGGCIKTPRKVVDVRVMYPQHLAAAGVGGEVVLNARVGIDGYLSDLKVADVGGAAAASGPHPDLITAALEAVRQWEFNPTLLNGVPVEANVTITVRFSTR